MEFTKRTLHGRRRKNGVGPMNNTTRAEQRPKALKQMAFGVALCAASWLSTEHSAHAQETLIMNQATSHTTDAKASEALTPSQQAIIPIAAFAAAGDLSRLNTALNQGLDAGLTVSDAKEILVQLYAYAGFPRSLNALGELMKVVEARKQRGIHDAPGSNPSAAIPKGDALLAAGTANQTRLSGAPVKGPLFAFAPAIDEYLKSHLFGDIFERDNLDWQSRELATVGMLSSLEGAESQLQAHMRISMNVGLTTAHLHQLTQVLADRVSADNARRAREALDRQLTPMSGPK